MKRSLQAGFTLIEIALVLVIVTLGLPLAANGSDVDMLLYGLSFKI